MAKMIKMVRVMVAIAADKLADVIEAVTDAGGLATVGGSGLANSTELDADADAEPDETPVGRALTRAATATHVTARRAPSTRLAGKVVYTPMGTQRQITRMLDDLRGVKTMRALVLRDLAKHPGSSNAEVRKRIAVDAKRNGLSVESVDNVIWKLTKDGVVGKEAEAE